MRGAAKNVHANRADSLESWRRLAMCESFVLWFRRGLRLRPAGCSCPPRLFVNVRDAQKCGHSERAVPGPRSLDACVVPVRNMVHQNGEQ